ncbi:ADP-glucose type glycogen/starch synthase [Candidatus Magnetoovum chiemensis]|nr:ADP-glucose type glycogen/starch synthase [Candidatus Magnetoovum chiemensis]
MHNRKCFFIDPHSEHVFFNRGIFYGHNDDAQRFAFFCRAALEFMYKSNKNPDVIHCHDWQTGLVPVLLFDMYKNLGMSHPRVCYTLHNLKHQGITGEHILVQSGLNPSDYCKPDRLQDDHNPFAVNLMKGGIIYSNFITTVSPQYAWDIRHSNENYGLGHTLYLTQDRFGGILNGIDYDVWNPEIDPFIPFKYGINNVEEKYKNKYALRDRLLLRNEFKPIICAVGRLDNQKGVHLIKHAVFKCLQEGWQFVLLGTAPEAGINEEFWRLKHEYNDHPDCHLEIGYNEELAHLIYAGSDMIVIPSLFEPCGLTQMIAMKYGTVPIVRKTGGLANTVFDTDHSDKPYHERNGYVFEDFHHGALDWALHRAVGLYYSYPNHFRELMINGMRYDFSWNNPGSHYLNVYNFIKE